MKVSYIAAAALALIVPTAAQAGVVFNGVCASTATATQAACTSTNGTYGNSVTLNSTTDATLKVKITAWQADQATTGPNANAITSAFLGAYSGGFGVTGVQDQNGTGNLHQIDNVNGYTDFVMLQFSRAVHLDGVNVNLYGINNVFDSDASFYNGSALASGAWNSSLSLSGYSNNTSSWSNTNGGSSAAYLVDGATGFSQVWLVSASMLTADRDDGFKLSSITVTAQTPAVPEPAAWAMLIVGFGAIGASLRRRGVRQSGVLAA